MKVVELDTAERVAPMVIVLKKHFTLSVCADYRWSSTLTYRDLLSTPRILNCINSIKKNALSFSH